MIQVKKFTFNPIQENTFVLYDQTGECIIVDAGCYFESEKIQLDFFIAENGLKPVLLLNTHCHFDHLLGVEYCRLKYNIPFKIPAGEAGMLLSAVSQGALFGIPTEAVGPPDAELLDKEQINFGNSSLMVISAEGHSPGGLTFYSEASSFLIAGDVLFFKSIGRTDLPGGSFEKLSNNIKTKLFTLPEDTVVYCGHGPETTIGFEKKNNPFLQD